MKKKQIFSVVAILLLIILVQAGMTGIRSGNIKNALSTVVAIKQNCDEEVYGIIVEYAINRTPLGGQMVSSDPEMSLPLSRKEPVYISFNSKGFNESYNLDNGTFGLFISVVTADGKETSVEYLYEWKAEYNREYNFTLTGNSTDGYYLTPSDDVSDCIVTPFGEL